MQKDYNMIAGRYSKLFNGLNSNLKQRVFELDKPTIDFAYACVVAIEEIKKGDVFSKENIWVKRPGTGEIKAVDFEKVLGKKATRTIDKNEQLHWVDIL